MSSMHPVIYLNKTMVEATRARVAPVSSAMLYGRGVFTTVAIYSGRPFLWPAHWERLYQGAERLSIDRSGLTEAGIGKAVEKLVTVNEVETGRARVILLARENRDFWRPARPGSRQTDLLIMTADQQQIRAAGLSLAVSPYRTNSSSPLVGIRSLNYLDHVLSWEEAQVREFDEAIMLNERGEIVSATMANIFWVGDGTVHTPTMNTGAFPGVTRGTVMDLAKKMFIPVLEGVYELSDLADADEIFLTSASLGVGLVTTFDFRQYAIGPDNLATRLRSAFQMLTGQHSSTEC